MKPNRPKWLMHLLVSIGFLVCGLRCFGQDGTTAKPGGDPLYLDSRAALDARVDDLVSRMTLDEKLSQLVETAVAIPRLQIPAYNWANESLHGLANTTATVFPEPIGLAASFDQSLMHEIGTAIGTEGRAKHHDAVRHGQFASGLDFWAPNLNIFRDPRWGRGQETYGEDPFLTGRMGVAYITGMQGDDPKYLRAIATPKHYAVHSGPEPARHSIDVKVSLHDEEDTYLPAFRDAVVEGKAGSIMCAYNRVNGDPACASSFLLETQLRRKWGFQGYVVSDCDSVADMFQGHHYSSSLAEAAALAMKRGTDLDCDIPGNDFSKYTDAVKQGLVDEKTLDLAVKRLMRARFALGMFDPPETVPYTQIPISENNSAAHRQLALRAARESIVLLKNDGILPLHGTIQNIAVVGPLADQVKVLLGNYNGTPSKATTILQGLQQQFPNSTVTFAAGTQFLRGAEAIPGKLLTTTEGQPGLTAEYFAARELKGEPVLKRVDRQVDFDFTGSDTVAEVGKVNFSVRWSGFLTPAVSGTYQIGTIADDGYRLWLDDKLILEDWTTHGASLNLRPIELQAGRKYALRMEYFQADGGAIAKLVWTPPGADPLTPALQATKNADLIVAVVGITSDLEGEENGVNQPGFKGGDRTSLDLPAEEQSLLDAVHGTGKPLVVVLLNGSALAVSKANTQANAILEGWYPGEEGGTAVAETLTGENNPAGRLPVTFYAGVEQLPTFEDYSMSNRTYRYFAGTPLYPFGFGLSYSRFAYQHLKLDSTRIKAGESLQVSAAVRNLSARDGDEVVQVYLGFPKVPGAPVRALRGFQRVHLRAGEIKYVQFQLNPRDLSYVTEAGERAIGPGTYSVSVGGGQPGTGAALRQADFHILGQVKIPD